MFLFISCTNGCSSESKSAVNSKEKYTSLTVVNWNTQTFFDANKDGCEYEDFLKSSDWNTEKYTLRLQRLCNLITELNADIYIFEELENERIIYDISNQLAESGQNWNQKKFWNYSFFAKPEGSAIGIGILSRYQLSGAKTHDMDIRIHSEKQPSSRYLVEATALVDNKKVIILANHWKSKSGGEEQTEIWRDWQENVLGKRLYHIINQNSDSDLCGIIICGDFNRDALDFVCNLKDQPNYIDSETNTIFRFSDFGHTDYVSASSLWFDSKDELISQNGSYYFDDYWEKIDNLFIMGKMKSAEFKTAASAPWATANGFPISYKIYSGEGFSDHLPLYAKLILSD